MIFVDSSYILLQPNRSQLRLLYGAVLTGPTGSEGQGGSSPSPVLPQLTSCNCFQTPNAPGFHIT